MLLCYDPNKLARLASNRSGFNSTKRPCDPLVSPRLLPMRAIVYSAYSVCTTLLYQFYRANYSAPALAPMTKGFFGHYCIDWLQGLDLHQRSPGYEPDEFLLLHPAIVNENILSAAHDSNVHLLRPKRSDLTRLAQLPTIHFHIANYTLFTLFVNQFFFQIVLVPYRGIEPLPTIYETAALPLC